MAKSMTRWIGLDVHAHQTHATVLVPETGELEQRRIEGRAGAVVEWLATLPKPFRAVYEAGPAGTPSPARRPSGVSRSRSARPGTSRVTPATTSRPMRATRCD